jgi:hypothetical protein
MFRHPKYYKELRDAGNELAKRNAVKEDLTSSGSSPARNKTDQAISSPDSREVVDSVRSGPGHKLQAASTKPQASSGKLSNQPQASSAKRQASQPE